MKFQIVELIRSSAIYVFVWVFGMYVHLCVLRIRYKLSSPACQAVMQNRIVGLEDHHTIKPALREEITAMIIHNIAPIFHHVFQLVTYLQISNKNVHINQETRLTSSISKAIAILDSRSSPGTIESLQYSVKCSDMHLYFCIYE